MQDTNVVGRITFQTTDPASAVSNLIDLIRSGQAFHAHFANAYTISLCERSDSYAAIFSSTSSLNFADGKPISWVSRVRRDRNRIRQVRGPSTFEGILQDERARPLRHFFLGGNQETLTQLRRTIADRYPSSVVAGTDSPPFAPPDPAELERRDNAIRHARPDVVWVGLGTPKQDWEARRICDELGLPVLAVGAAFGFLAGTMREAPTVYRRLGLEWAYRFAHEPRRLWRRYLLGNCIFLWSVARNWMRGPAR